MTHPSESVFPQVQKESQFNTHSYGLTKREYFAAIAMQGLLSNSAYNNPNEKWEMVSVSGLAEAAVCYADGLINELNKT